MTPPREPTPEPLATPETLDVERLRVFANWAAQLDDPANPEHRTVTLRDIAERAQTATFTYQPSLNVPAARLATPAPSEEEQ